MTLLWYQHTSNSTSISLATSDLTLYIDNVRVGMTAAGLPGDYNANGTVDAADYVLWRNGGPLANEVADPGTISPADYHRMAGPLW